MTKLCQGYVREPAVDFPFAPRKSPFFYGWVILAVSIVGTLLSTPGQTIGVGVFKEPLLKELPISEVHLTLAYMIGTVGSSLMLPWAGKLLDMFGARLMTTVVSVLMGLSLVLFSQCTRVVGWWGRDPSLVVMVGVMSFVYLAIRFLGQGCLLLFPRVMVGKWFNHRRGLAFGIMGVFLAFGFNSAPTFLNRMVQSLSWQGTLWALAAAVGGGGTLWVWLFYRDNPESCGLVPDGVDDPEWLEEMARKFPDVQRDFTCLEAVRTVPFWAFGFGLASHGLLATAVAFHIATIASNQGISSGTAYATFIPMAGVGVASNFLGAWLSDRVKLRRLLFVMMSMQIAGMIGLMDMSSPVGRGIYIVGMGIAGGLHGALSAVVWPRYYGRAHLGAISGLNMSMIVFGSAIGPLFFSLGQSYTGSYVGMMAAAMLLPASVLALGLFSENPQRKYAQPIE